MNRQFEITYLENGVIKTLIKFGRSQREIEANFKLLAQSLVEFVKCERVEYLIKSIRASIPFDAILYVKIRTTINGSEIVEASAWNTSLLEYIEANQLETVITRHPNIAPILLEHLEQIRLEEAIQEKPIIYLKQVAA